MTEANREEILKRIGKNIRILRIERELAQEVVAERAGVHRTHMTKIESGQSNPSALTLYRIARALDAELGDLFAKL